MHTEQIINPSHLDLDKVLVQQALPVDKKKKRAKKTKTWKREEIEELVHTELLTMNRDQRRAWLAKMRRSAGKERKALYTV